MPESGDTIMYIILNKEGRRDEDFELGPTPLSAYSDSSAAAFTFFINRFPAQGSVNQSVPVVKVGEITLPKIPYAADVTQRKYIEDMYNVIHKLYDTLVQSFICL